MNRRKFFAFFGLAPTAAAVKVPEPLGPREFRDWRYRSWRIRVTDWIPDIETAREVCQATAWPLNPDDSLDRSRPCVYAVYPGQQGRYRPGDLFCLIPAIGQKLIEHGCSDEDRTAARRDCLRRLMAIVDEVDRA